MAGCEFCLQSKLLWCLCQNESAKAKTDSTSLEQNQTCSPPSPLSSLLSIGNYRVPLSHCQNWQICSWKSQVSSVTSQISWKHRYLRALTCTALSGGYQLPPHLQMTGSFPCLSVLSSNLASSIRTVLITFSTLPCSPRGINHITSELTLKPEITNILLGFQCAYSNGRCTRRFLVICCLKGISK